MDDGFKLVVKEPEFKKNKSPVYFYPLEREKQFYAC